MSEPRFRVPIEDDYATAVGRAAYIFAYLEWQVVWCAEKLQPGFLANLGIKTAGQIGIEFEQLTLAVADDALKLAMHPLAQEFRSLVRERNSLLHGKPGTVSGSGQQRLFRNGVPWHIADLDSAADRFAACSIALNSNFHG